MMKKIFTLFLISSLFFVVNAQSEWCGTDELLNKYHEQHPEKAVAYQEDILRIANAKLAASKSNHKKVVPVVVHVIHYNGAGNITKAQILDGMRVLNEDFNKLNSDTSTIRSIFAPIAESMDIEFRLAKKDPNGNCTDGITRTNSHLSMGPSNRNAPKSLIQWDPFRYLNIWVVNTFDQSTLLGFAQFPSPNAGALSTYGLMLKSNEFGTIGSAQGNAGRTLTHEVGHCFELFHPFQGGCPQSFQSCHNSGDFICDVPPQISALNNTCNFSINSCQYDDRGGVPGNTNPYTSNVNDQLENIMGYGTGCSVMLTGGQSNRMNTAFNTYSKLISLIDTANLTTTGTNNGYVAPLCAPIAEVLTFDRFVCAGSSIAFTDDSYGGATSTYSWSFPGGTPSTSTQAQPNISYNSSGTYDVVLRVSNAAGTDSIVLNDYVHVSDSINVYSGFNYVESFENATQFNNEWVIIDKGPTPTWARAAFAAKSGSASIWLNNLNTTYDGARDELISPSIKMSDVLNPSISVEVAYRRKNSSSNDKLIFSASLDCGASWITILSTTPAFFAYDNSTQTTNFVPTQGSQWKTVSIPSQFIPASIKTSDQVKFRFEFEHQGGNNVYIDDFKILGQPTSLDENQRRVEENVMVYPNPANDQFKLVYRPKQEGQANIYLRNVVGEKVQTIFNGNMTAREYKFLINSSELSKGIYFLNIEGKERIIRKVVFR